MLPRMVLLSLIVAFTSVTATALPGDEPPPWLVQAAALTAPGYDKDVPAVVLYHEQVVTVGSDGRLTTVVTYAVRFLTREGRYYATAGAPYLTNSSKIREMRAWMIPTDGKPIKYGKDRVIDSISDPNDIYNEYRVMLIDAENDAEPGSVFGYQFTSEERPLFQQDIWRFQSRLPTLLSRYRLVLPEGWKASSVTFNRQKVEPSVNALTYTWELNNLPPIRPEAFSPNLINLAPRIAINYFEADSALTTSKTFENWGQVSRWATYLHDPQAVPDANVTTKARELTANAKTDLERIRAIAQFVQRLQYISIDVGIGKGNGYKPHAAPQVLAKSYGDCKDKANLMRSMLQTLDITSYPIAIYSGDPTFVREEWASPNQFNHIIIAVKVGDNINLPTVIQHPTLGRLLIFDATDEHSPVGDLPDHEQGSLALIIAGDAGTLTRMPVMPPESSQLDRQADVSLSAEGSITATIKERSTGQSAVEERRAFRKLSAGGYKEMIEAWITQGATSARVSRVEPVDNEAEGRFGLDLDFSAPAYGQLMQDRLLVFNPAIVSRRERLFLTEASRTHPVVLESHAFTETVRVKLPVGFHVDELPEQVKLDTSFGSYKTSYEVKSGELVFVRSLAQKATTIPADQYQTVRNFFAKIRAAEQAPVVLVRK